MENISGLYSDRARKMRKSEIRELLKVTQDPEIISFGADERIIFTRPLTFPLLTIIPLNSFTLLSISIFKKGLIKSLAILPEIYRTLICGLFMTIKFFFLLLISDFFIFISDSIGPSLALILDF